MSFNPQLSEKSIKETDTGLIYPVYITSRVVRELIDFCKSTVPKEALGFLLGVKVEFKDDPRITFTKIVDWVTGSVDSTHISASFTTEGLEQANRFLDDKYGKSREQYEEIPKICGIVHSHPFNFEPEFSHTDLNTFLNFPYDADGNVFILIDPVSTIPYFKVYKIMFTSQSGKVLQHVPWIEYSAIESDLAYTKFDSTIKENPLDTDKSQLQESESIEPTTKEEDPYIPPTIEKLGSNGKTKNTKKINLREFF